MRQSAPCPYCGKPLSMRPDAALAVRVLAVGGGSAFVSLIDRDSWIAVAAALSCVLGLYLASGFFVVRFFPMRHVSATDSAASSYRVLIAVMLLFGVAIIALAYSVQHGA